METLCDLEKELSSLLYFIGMRYFYVKFGQMLATARDVYRVSCHSFGVQTQWVVVSCMEKFTSVTHHLIQ